MESLGCGMTGSMPRGMLLGSDLSSQSEQSALLLIDSQSFMNQTGV